MYPNLAEMAFRVDDPGDHLGGGHCLSLPDGEAERWLAILDQHCRVLELLAGGQPGQIDGWALTRPALFTAHHACELALKRLLVERVGSVGGRTHRLVDLWSRLSGHLPSALSPADTAWMCSLIELMGALTSGGFDGRYPDEEDDVATRWCCLNLARLKECVDTFVAFSLIGVTELA